MTAIRICPRCKNARPEDTFKKPGGWCAACRSAYHERMKALNDKRAVERKVAKRALDANQPPVPKRRPPGEAIALALATGEAKGKAIVYGKGGRKGKAAWANYYRLLATLIRSAFEDLHDPDLMAEVVEREGLDKERLRVAVKEPANE